MLLLLLFMNYPALSLSHAALDVILLALAKQCNSLASFPAISVPRA